MLAAVEGLMKRLKLPMNAEKTRCCRLPGESMTFLGYRIGRNHRPVTGAAFGDGAEWIWNLSAEQFPGAIQIVDIYHAKGHLCDVAKAIYGAGTDLAAQWGKDRRDELDAGRFDAILTALRAHRETCEEARKCID